MTSEDQEPLQSRGEGTLRTYGFFGRQKSKDASRMICIIDASMGGPLHNPSMDDVSSQRSKNSGEIVTNSQLHSPQRLEIHGDDSISIRELLDIFTIRV